MGSQVSSDQKHREFLSKKMFDNLDGLRGLSILLVLLHHTSAFDSGPLRTLQENGSLGVPIFFSISGFLIITLMLREEADNGRIALWRFYGRRAVRLFPLYYIVLAIYCVLVFRLGLAGTDKKQLFVARLPAYLAYYSNVVYPYGGPFSHAWSLAFEEQFYFLFGLLMVFIPRRLLSLVLGVVSLLYIAPVFGLNVGNFPILRWAIFFPASIVYGVGVAHLLNSRTGHAWFHELGRPLVTWLLLVAILGLLFTPNVGGSQLLISILYLLVALLVLSCVVQGPLPILNSRALSYVGRVCYGIYLQHVLCKHIVMKISENPAFVLAAMFILSLLIAHFSFKYFEQRLIRHFRARLTPEPQPRGSLTT
jgi:peptidoglycan/LPS O-acetylase OafA/YrhL